MKIRAHESFYLRKGWLQKGIKNILKDGRIFNNKDANACDELGIGSNMVKSLKYWLLATNVAEECYNEENKKVMRPTSLGKVIDKYDRYYEEIGTLLIIHYNLAKNKDFATAWYWLFNKYQTAIIDKDIFVRDLNEYIVFNGGEQSKVLDDEYNCIVKTYISSEKEDDPEETKICPLTELKLLEYVDVKKKEVRKAPLNQMYLDPMIAFAFICDMAQGRKEIRVEEICNAECGLGKIFNMTRTSIIMVLEQLVKQELIRFNRTAGLDIVDIMQPMAFLDAIESYYKKLDGENK